MFIRESMIAKQTKSNITEVTGHLDVIQKGTDDEQFKM